MAAFEKIGTIPAGSAPDPADLISADAGNQIVQGSDRLLYVGEPPPQIQGSVPTVADLPPDGEPGQYWIVEADGNLYGWSE